jgi:hypothetical protein
MKTTFYKFFDDIGDFITSRAIVIILMVPFMWYRYYEFRTLFNEWLPIKGEDLQTAASLISLVCITVTLLFMVNVKDLFNGVKLILAFTAFTLNLFFWSLGDNPNWYFVIFISAMIASMDYGQSHLFDSQQQARKKHLDLSSLEISIENEESNLEELKFRISKLEPVHQEYLAVYEKCYCAGCKRAFPSQQAKNAHKCKTN